MSKKHLKEFLRENFKEQLKKQQAGAELGQAQLMLGMDYTLIFCRFRFSRLGLAELVGWI